MSHLQQKPHQWFYKLWLLYGARSDNFSEAATARSTGRSRLVIDKAAIEDVYSKQIGEFTSKPSSVIDTGSRINVVGIINDNEEIVARYGRTFFVDEQKVRHSSFTVDGVYRGRGVAKQFTEAWETSYRDMGIKQISASAEYHGAYFWVSQGYDAENID